LEQIPKEIIFTSGAAESIQNLSLKGKFHDLFPKELFILSAVRTEQQGSFGYLGIRWKKGAEITIECDFEGKIDSEELKNSIRPETKMIHLSAANK